MCIFCCIVGFTWAEKKKKKKQAFGKDKPAKATELSALECCMLICEDVLMHKLHNSSEVQHWGFPTLSEPQRQKKTDNVHQRWCHFKICYFQHSNITRMKHSSCLSQPPLSSVSLQPSVDPQKLHQRGWEGDVLQDVCPLTGIALSTRALP